jgi:putative redox protein
MREVTVRGVSETGLAMHVAVGTHVLTADEPVEAGGSDTGPKPHELLLAAAATCTVMTIRLYAGRKGWDVGRVSVRATGGTVDGTFRIREAVTFGGNLAAAQRMRLLEIAGRCPVHRTLAKPVDIRVVEEPGATM